MITLSHPLPYRITPLSGNMALDRMAMLIPGVVRTPVPLLYKGARGCQYVKQPLTRNVVDPRDVGVKAFYSL
jgi:hypothetical protein